MASFIWRGSAPTTKLRLANFLDGHCAEADCGANNFTKLVARHPSPPPMPTSRARSCKFGMTNAATHRHSLQSFQVMMNFLATTTRRIDLMMNLAPQDRAGSRDAPRNWHVVGGCGAIGRVPNPGTLHQRFQTLRGAAAARVARISRRRQKILIRKHCRIKVVTRRQTQNASPRRRRPESSGSRPSCVTG